MPRQRGDLIDRREALRLGGTAVLVLGSPALGGHPGAGAQAAALVTRAVPSSGERLPVVGVGTARRYDVGASPEARAPLREVLRELPARGGKVVDTAPSYGAAETAAMELIERSGRRHGLEARWDAARNLVLRLPGRDAALPAIATGSHLDSVPQGGNFDGAAGVIASLLGLLAAPYRGAYCASKFAVEALADTLRMELSDSGIHVSLIEPGPIASRFVEHAIEAYRRNVDLEASHHREIYKTRIAHMEAGGSQTFKLGPEAVVAKLVQALDSKRPKPRYYVTLPSYAVALLRRVLPAGALDAVARRN